MSEPKRRRAPAEDRPSGFRRRSRISLATYLSRSFGYCRSIRHARPTVSPTETGATPHPPEDPCHWADGGETRLDNLVLLCRHHHRLVHEGGYSVQMSEQGIPLFTDPAGCTIPEVGEKSFRGNVFTLRQQNRSAGLDIGPDTPISLWEGEIMDTSMAIEGLLYRESGSEQPKT